MILSLFAAAAAADPALYRVDDPDRADAIARSAFGSVLAAPPEAGTRYRLEEPPSPDVVDAESLPERWGPGDVREALNADVWHDRGVTGQGVKVAVFDLQWFGGGADSIEVGQVGTHDCWTHPACEAPLEPWRPRFSYEEGVHGVACAEAVHDVAPDAELHLVRVNGATTFENAADWAIREGVDVVTMSLSFFNNSFYDGTGPISATAERMVAGGVTLLTSAGNYAESHWRGRVLDGDLDGRVDMDGANGLWIYLGAGAHTVYVSWSEFGSCGTSDLDAVLRNEDGDLLGRTDDVQLPSEDDCLPVERVSGTVKEAQWVRLEVEIVRGPAVATELAVLATTGEVDGSMPIGSMADPASSPWVVGVGAIEATGYATNDVEYFSSQGFDGKPEIGGPDGLSVTAYGPTGFYGTSAATPAVAGALALVMSEEPGRTAQEAMALLKAWALDGDAATFQSPDPRWGAGKARLPVEPQDLGCGRRPLILPVLLVPLLWGRRRGPGAGRRRG
jgi:subtilisin family serine protease